MSRLSLTSFIFTDSVSPITNHHHELEESKERIYILVGRMVCLRLHMIFKQYNCLLASCFHHCTESTATRDFVPFVFTCILASKWHVYYPTHLVLYFLNYGKKSTRHWLRRPTSVKSCGCLWKFWSQSWRGTSLPTAPDTIKSMAFAFSVRLNELLNCSSFIFGCCLSHLQNCSLHFMLAN